MTTLLIAHHSPTAHVAALRDALHAGATDDAIEGVEVDVRSVADVQAEHLIDADGVLLLTPANFGYMAGMVKDMFDRTFLDIGGALSDDGSGEGSAGGGGKKPYGLCVHGRYDTTGAEQSVQTIVGALPWTQAAEVLSVIGDVDDAATERAYELGGTLAALLMP
ncbi:flavodoxin family protein [Nocardioidaceae bacterium]|nr:flavodoxin family protein [Nocardioidaceae bacterium]